VDAHADANTPDTSPSLHYHGMPAAHVMGWFKKPIAGFEWLKGKLSPQRIAYIGLRDIDPEEGRMLTEAGIRCFTMQQVDRLGISEVVRMALEAVDPYHKRPLPLSFDIDAIDPAYAPGTGTLARGGLTYRESHYICEDLATTNRLVGMDLVEVNPLVDARPARMHGDDPDMAPTTTTVSLAMELCLSGLGKNILNQALNDHKFFAEPKSQTRERLFVA
jgi:arginase